MNKASAREEKRKEGKNRNKNEENSRYNESDTFSSSVERRKLQESSEVKISGIKAEGLEKRKKDFITDSVDDSKFKPKAKYEYKIISLK